MSADTAVDKSCCCASCGIAQADDVKLKKCTACYLVRYCSIKCQKDNRKQHKRVCKKRAAELRDELLFKQPEGTHLGDCPICMIPLPLDRKKSTLMSCCSKVVCYGCFVINLLREKKAKTTCKCPFCREATPETEEEFDERRMERGKINDPVALSGLGIEQLENGNYRKAFEYLTRAAQLGDVEAHFNLSTLYFDGFGVEKDGAKEIYHLEEAAIGGHPAARYNLGCIEMDNGNTERAVKHRIIAACQGHDQSMKALKDAFKKGCISKEDLAATVRAHQAAVDATKSPQREAVETQREAALKYNKK